jgi:hypothetical protein
MWPRNRAIYLAPIGAEIRFPILQLSAHELWRLFVKERSCCYRGLRRTHPNTEAQKQLSCKKAAESARRIPYGLRNA